MKFEDIMKDNEQNIKDLINKIKSGSICPYIGAGMSVLFDNVYPTWSEFLNNTFTKFIKNIKEWGKFESLNYEDKAEYLYNSEFGIGRETFNKHLRDTYGEKHLNRSAYDFVDKSVYLLPVIFESGLLITTNYDKVIEKVYGLHEKVITVAHPGHYEALNLALRDGLLVLYKIHGDIAEPETSIILTKKQYETGYSEPKLIQTLRQAYENKAMLFLGCSMTKDRPLELLQRISRPGMSNFAIISCKEEDIRARRLELEENFNTQAIIYPDGKHEYLRLILEYIAREINPDGYKKAMEKFTDAAAKSKKVYKKDIETNDVDIINNLHIGLHRYVENKALEEKLSKKIKIVKNEAKIVVVEGNRGIGKTTTCRYIINDLYERIKCNIIEICYENYTNSKRNIFYLLQKIFEKEILLKGKADQFEFGSKLEAYIEKYCDQRGLILYIDNYHGNDFEDIWEFYRTFEKKSLLIIVSVATGASAINKRERKDYIVLECESTLNDDTRVKFYEEYDKMRNIYNYEQYQYDIKCFLKNLPEWLATPYVIKFFASIIPNYQERIPQKLQQFSAIINKLVSDGKLHTKVDYDKLLEEIILNIFMDFISDDKKYLNTKELNMLCLFSMLFDSNVPIREDLVFSIYLGNNKELSFTEEKGVIYETIKNLEKKGYINQEGGFSNRTYKMHDLYKQIFFTYLKMYYSKNEEFLNLLWNIAKNLAKIIHAGTSGSFLQYYNLVPVCLNIFDFIKTNEIYLKSFYPFIELGNNLSYLLLKTQDSELEIQKACNLQKYIISKCEKTRQNGYFFLECNCSQDYNRCNNTSYQSCFYKASIYHNVYAKALLTLASSKLNDPDIKLNYFEQAKEVLSELENKILTHIMDEKLKTKRVEMINYTTFLLYYKMGIVNEYDESLLEVAQKYIQINKNSCINIIVQDYKEILDSANSEELHKLQGKLINYSDVKFAKILISDLKKHVKDKKSFLRDILSYLISLYMESYIDFLMVRRTETEHDCKETAKVKIRFAYSLIKDKVLFEDQYDDQRRCECSIVYSEIMRGTKDFVSAFCVLLDALHIKKERILDSEQPKSFSFYISINFALILLVDSILNSENIENFMESFRSEISKNESLYNKICEWNSDMYEALKLMNKQRLEEVLSECLKVSKLETEFLLKNYYIGNSDNSSICNYWSEEELYKHRIQKYLDLNITI